MYEMKVPAIATKQSNSTDEKPRKSGAMPAHRPPANPPQNHPTTPVAPRVKAPQRIAPSPSASLHPNITTRSPKGSASSTTWRARADSAAAPGLTTLNTASAPRPYVVRPTSSASTRTITRPESTNTSTSGSSGRLSVSNGSQMFFHASKANVPISTPLPHSPYSAPQAQSAGPKFFHADGAEAAEGPVEPFRRRTRGLSSSPQLTSNIPMLPPGPPPRNGNHSPPAPTASPRLTSTAFVNPRTPSLAPSLTPTSPEPRSHVKFVYADGAEEVLEPRTQTSDSTSTSTSPQFPASPTFSGSSNGASPVKVAYPISPLASPNAFNSPPQYPQRHAAQSSSRRTSLDLKVRNGRAVSIGSVIEMSSSTEETQGSDNLEQQTSEDTGSSEDEREDDEGPEGTRSPLPMTAAERIKEMEARAANARRERKVMDLEISNASLLAINKTLEREMRKQAAELRRYKRLARSGRLTTSPVSREDFIDDMSVVSESDAAGIAEDEPASEPDDEDDETERMSEEEDDDEEESAENDEKHRDEDEKRLVVDLSRYQTLLDASVKMNASLKHCQIVTDQLIREGKKAFEYQVRPSDVGGRVLVDEEDPYYETTDELTSMEDTEDEENTFLDRYTPEESRPVRHSLV